MKEISELERYHRGRVLKTFFIPWIPVIVLGLAYIFTVENEALNTLNIIIGVLTLLAFVFAIIFFMRSVKSYRDEM